MDTSSAARRRRASASRHLSSFSVTPSSPSSPPGTASRSSAISSPSSSSTSARDPRLARVPLVSAPLRFRRLDLRDAARVAQVLRLKLGDGGERLELHVAAQDVVHETRTRVCRESPGFDRKRSVREPVPLSRLHRQRRDARVFSSPRRFRIRRKSHPDRTLARSRAPRSSWRRRLTRRTTKGRCGTCGITRRASRAREASPRRTARAAPTKRTSPRSPPDRRLARSRR